MTIGVTLPEGVTANLDFATGSAPFMSILTLTIPANMSAGDYTVIVTGTAGSTVRSDEITFTTTSIPEFSLDIDNREQIIADGTMQISGVINAHNGLDLTIGGALDILIEPYNQDLLDSAVITWGAIDSNGDLPFTITFTVDESIPRNEYTINMNVVALDGGVTHSASVAFVTESSTLDGTAVAADSSAISNGDTSMHDGTDSSAQSIQNNETKSDDSSKSESKSSNTGILIGSTIGIIGIAAVVAYVVLRGRNSTQGKDFNDQLWNQQPNMMPGTVAVAPQPMMQQPAQPAQFAQPTMLQPMMQQPAQPAPIAPQTAPAPPAPAPPAQPTTVADYTGLPPGGQYDQSTGQTIYIQADGVRWQMMADGSFNRL